MLVIGDKETKIMWWLGYPIPENLGPVVKLQVDGHELEMLYRAMETAYIGDGGRVVFKQIPNKKRTMSERKNMP